MRRIIKFSLFLSLVLMSYVCLANKDMDFSSNFEKEEELLERITKLQAQVKDIKGQYISITSQLEKIQLNIPKGLENFPDLFILNDDTLVVGPDGNIYYDGYEIRDVLCSINGYYESNDSTNNAEQTRSGYVTTEQFNQLASLVFTLSANCQTLNNNLNSISNTVYNITQQMSMMSATVQYLSTQCENLSQKCDLIDSAIDIKDDGRIVVNAASPIMGVIEPVFTPSLYSYPSVWSWEGICTKFNVSTNSHLKSITLYCNDINKIMSPESVYVSTGVSNNSGYQMDYWYCNSVNTNRFPLCTYSFSNPILIRSDRFHLLGIRKIGNNLIYPYVCNGYRNGGLYKPYGANESEPPLRGDDPPDPGPRVGPSDPPMTLSEFMNMTFEYYWEPCFDSYELWSVFNFVEDVGFTFDKHGLELKSGDISIAGTRVVTDESLGVALTNRAEVLEGKISWDSFCQGLKDYLITVNGGTITGELYVEDLILPNNGSWLIGNATTRSDIKINNPNGCITTSSGDLNLACNGEDTKIIAHDFVQFSDSEQCGKVIISAGSTSVSIASDLSSDAVVTVTPSQQTNVKYWVEINSLGGGSIVIDEQTNCDLSFFYMIMRK